jgi:hypothetical protein
MPERGEKQPKRRRKTMFRKPRGITAPLLALALLAVFAGRSEAQYVYYSSPAVSYYYTPRVAYYTPAVSYYTPAVSYYTPAVSYYTPAVRYYAPAVSYYTPAVSYYTPAVSYYPSTTVTTYRYGAILPRRRVTVTTYSTPGYYAPAYYYGP